MPHRHLRTVHGVLGSMLVIFGIYMVGLGTSWLMIPTGARESGVQWLNESSLPVSGLSSAHVAWWWVAGGLLTLAGGLFSRKPALEKLGVAAGILFPVVVAALFVGAWVDGAARTGIISAWSYALPAVVVLWSAFQEGNRAQEIKAEVEAVTGQMEAVK